MDYPNLQSVQIIYNMFRHRPAEIFLNEAKRRQVGVLARVPLVVGLADRQNGARYEVRDTRITASSTDTARSSTAAKRFQASTMKRGCKPSKN